MVRIRFAILAVAVGALLYWAWGDLMRAAGAATFESVGGLEMARAELSRYHCGDSELEMSGVCSRWTVPYDSAGADVAFYSRHQPIFDDRAARENRERRAAALRASLDALAPLARKALLLVALAAAAMLLAPLASSRPG